VNFLTFARTEGSLAENMKIRKSSTVILRWTRSENTRSILLLGEAKYHAGIACKTSFHSTSGWSFSEGASSKLGSVAGDSDIAVGAVAKICHVDHVQSQILH
jgi:hypothetical protein